MTAVHFEDFRMGQVFETLARTITETDLVTFAGWSWDTNPVHTDAWSSRGSGLMVSRRPEGPGQA